MSQSSSIRLFSKPEKASQTVKKADLIGYSQFERQMQIDLESFSGWIQNYQQANLHFLEDWGDKIMESQLLSLTEYVLQNQRVGNKLSGPKIRALSSLLKSDSNFLPHLHHARKSLKAQASHALTDAQLHYLKAGIDPESNHTSESYPRFLFEKTMRELEDHYHLILSQRRTSTALKLVSCFALPLLLLWNR